ncbi:unnamed protein product, partial [Didymodactylos carnosus]
MLAINTSIAKTMKKTPFEMVFCQQPRSDEDFWKCIQQQMKENDANNSAISDIENGIMLEENLPLDAATLFEEFDKTVSQSDNDNDDLLYNHNKSDNEEDNDNNNSVINYPVDDIIQNSHQNAFVDAEENMNNNDDPITWLNSITDSSDKDRVIQYDADSSSFESSASASSSAIRDLSACSPVYERHKKIREEGEKSYLSNAQSQLLKYITNSAKRPRTYVIGDIIGLKISDVDRTNSSSTVLPCKVVRCNTENGKTLYTVATQTGIIIETFESATFLDLTTANFATLRALNTDLLPLITFIQACQIYTNFKSADTCKRADTCNTKRCPRKKNNHKCCTKCHGGKATKCENC